MEVIYTTFSKRFEYIKYKGGEVVKSNKTGLSVKELDIKIKPKYNIGSNSHNFWKPYKFYENREDLVHKVSEIYKEDIKRYNYNFLELEK